MDQDSEYSERTGKKSKSGFMSPYRRQQYTSINLAEPRKDLSQTTLYSKIRTRRTYAGISVAALKARCSPHTSLLAWPRKPLPKIYYMTFAEREAQREREEEMTKEELRWLHRKPIPVVNTGVKKAALTAKCSPRLSVIAMAKLLYLSYNKRNYFDKMGEQQKNALIRHIREHMEEFRAMNPPEADQAYHVVNGAKVHVNCSGREEVQRLEKFICELDKAERKAFRRRMKKLGEPRKVFSASQPDRGPKKKLKEFEPRQSRLAQPRFNLQEQLPYDPFQVKPSAKRYVITDRVRKMAEPRVPPPPPPFVDFEGNELPPRREWSFNSRRRIVTPARTLELATPRFVKKKAAEDTKEDPFAVPRRALTAFCTPRTKELAEPRKRG